MLIRAVATVTQIVSDRNGVQEIETPFGPAINYVGLTGEVSCGDQILLNRTAAVYGLGTGGNDYVMARLDDDAACVDQIEPGHIVKLRYTPLQHTVRTLEEDAANAQIWDKDLSDFPVVVGQLHSQIAPVAAALTLRRMKCAYIMTDGAALPLALSRLVASLTDAGMIAHTVTAGQAFGGDYEAVTVHSALLAARHLLSCDAAVVCQGPGNTGTGTRYGFSGIEQASLLDTVAALGGTPIAVARISGADARDRHRGISHHTMTSLQLVRSRCRIALPEGIDAAAIGDRHAAVAVAGTSEVLDYIRQKNVELKSMGRSPDDDRLFFEAAAAAGILAAQVAANPERPL